MTDYISNVCVEKETTTWYAWYNSSANVPFIYTLVEAPSSNVNFYIYRNGQFARFGQIRSYDGVNNTITIPSGLNPSVTIYNRYSNEDDTRINYPATPIGGDNFDGQWVYSELTLVNNNVTLGANGLRTFDLSSYLPDDDYDYEVLFAGSMWTGSSSGNAVGATIASGTVSSYIEEKFLRMGRCNTRSSSTHGMYYHGMIPIYATDRAVTFCNHDGSGNSGTWYLYAKAYRRIGKNNDTTSSYISNISFRDSEKFNGHFSLDPATLRIDNVEYSTINLYDTQLVHCFSDNSTYQQSTLLYKVEYDSTTAKYTRGELYGIVKSLNFYEGSSTNGTIIIIEPPLSIGGNNFDGQWVFSKRTLISGTALNAETSYTYDLSDYLPNDGYDYEVFISDCYGVTTATSGQSTRLYAENTNGLSVHLLCAVTRTSSTEAAKNNLILPISTDRQLIIRNSNVKTGEVWAYLFGYRRIGTND